MEEDSRLIQIVDAAMAEAVRKSGSWLACRPGCCECCTGPFPITELDARRLREGLSELERRDPQRAARIRQRASETVRKWQREYPGHTLERILAEDDAAESDACPALDLDTKTCDLYGSRPVTCRTFGPAVRFGEQSLAVCELCYQGAADEQIARCEVEVDSEDLEGRLLEELGNPADTTVAFALAP